MHKEKPFYCNIIIWTFFLYMTTQSTHMFQSRKYKLIIVMSKCQNSLSIALIQYVMSILLKFGQQAILQSLVYILCYVYIRASS